MDKKLRPPLTGRTGISRLISYVDAVTAIAMTLLILPLVDDASRIGAADLAGFIRDDAYELFAFALSFVVIFRLWLAHHHTYEQVTGGTPALIWANMPWMLGVVFLPFPTELLDDANRESPLANGLYVGTLAWISACGLIQQLIIHRTPEIRPPDAGPVALAPAGILTLLMLLALAVSVLFVRIGLWGLLLLFLQGPALRLVSRIQSPRTRQ